MKLLFLSRAYPPIIGGLENHNYELYQQLQKKAHTDSIINTKGKTALPFFIPYCCLKSIFLLRKYDAIVLGDGVLLCIGWLIKLISPNKPVICIVHGLDITYSNYFYQYFWINIFLPKIDKIIAVSRATADTVMDQGINKSKLEVIPNGINPLSINHPQNRKQLENILQVSCKKKTILLTVGRLVKRKGVHWFINHVMPFLNEQFIYVIVGDGSDRDSINKIIIEKNLSNRVFCLGFVDNNVKNIIYSSADLFIQPNIKVAGDMEGFGISVLEANTHGLAVLGADIEGLKDSITENKNGWLLESKNPSGFIKKIEEVTQSDFKLKQAGENARAFCLQNYCWDKIADQYIEILNKLLVEKNEH